jgi:hypothetical protein
MKSDIKFKTEDGISLSGFFYEDESSNEPKPTIVMAHGFTGVIDALKDYADFFHKSGFNVLLYEHRSFGKSEGAPRFDINPYQQLSDFRDAITYAQSLPKVDAKKIGIWGSSYAGGHVIALGACDRRVQCVVSQIPYVSGHDNAPRIYSSDVIKGWQKKFIEERISLANGNEPTYVPVFSSDKNTSHMAALGYASERFIEASESSEGWVNKVTLRSVEYFMEYEPGGFAEFVSPTPLLMIIGAKDNVNPPDISLKIYEKALHPKHVVVHPGGHFGTYTLQFSESSGAALEWFKRYLMN